MKKIICALMAVLLVLACTISVNATEYTLYNDYESQGEMTAYGHQYSKYVIEIPDVISTGVSEQITFSDVDLEDGYSIKVAVTNLNDDGYITMTHTADSSITANMSISGNVNNSHFPTIFAQYSHYEIERDESSVYINTVMDYDAPAGNYTGAIQYAISCDEFIDYM